MKKTLAAFALVILLLPFTTFAASGGFSSGARTSSGSFHSSFSSGSVSHSSFSAPVKSSGSFSTSFTKPSSGGFAAPIKSSGSVSAESQAPSVGSALSGNSVKNTTYTPPAAPVVYHTTSWNPFAGNFWFWMWILGRHTTPVATPQITATSTVAATTSKPVLK